MIIYVGKDYQDVSRKAANIMSAQIIMKPNAVLGLATGSTPVGLYKQLIEWYNKGDLDFSQITSVNLDEYKGLSGDNDQSYRYFMNTNLFDHVNIDKTRTYVPNGLEEDSDKACADYNEIIRSVGGIDIQLLGIGGNGHIGFNEPGEAFEKETHCVDLTESTIKANARFFESMDEVPKQAYTMGIKNIMAEYEVIDKGSNGFLGIGSRDAVIKVKKAEASVEDEIREFLDSVFKAMKLEVTIDIKVDA